MTSHKRQKVRVINLGCARNLVDAQEIAGYLKRKGHAIVETFPADTVILNTCAFIEDAKRESVESILELIELKKKGRIKRIVLAGCLAQRYGAVLSREFTQVDALVGVPLFSRDKVLPQVYLTPAHYAYLKICESCYNRCRFCAIPLIKGKFRSRRMGAVLSQMAALDKKGVKEVNIIGQDITAYGMDIYKRKSLARLLRRAVRAAKHIQWIRLLYTYPAHITDELIDVIAREKKICRYIDVPLQHISDPLLKKMNRRITARQTQDLINRLRGRIPEACLRTTFIVGLPGETEKDFDQLADFVRGARFEKLGVFMYSREEGTPAYGMPGQVPEHIKRKRYDTLMKIQQEISHWALGRMVGRTLPVLIEGNAADFPVHGTVTPVPEDKSGLRQYYVGRSEYDAPDVDGVVYVKSRRKLKPGDFVDVRVQEAYTYDLVGEIL